jgi:hypothetical protein
MFSGQWKVPSFMAFGKRRRSIIFTSSTFHPKRFNLKEISIDLRVLLYHGFKLLLRVFLSFPLTYKLHLCFDVPSLPHIIKLILIENFPSFPWIHGIVHGHVLWASSHTNEWKIALRIVFKFNINLTPLWWRSWTIKSAPSFRSRTPSSLVLSNFSKFLYLGDFVVGQLHFWWWTWNCVQRFYEIENTSIFAWFLIFDTEHYCWLHNSICWLPPKKSDYLVCTIWCILNFLQLWTSIVA